MAHPKAGGNSGITEILNVEDVASLVAYFVGRSSLRRFRAAWLAGARWAAEALPLLRTRCTGSVYVCGGYSGAVKLRSAERFNPVEGSWEMLPAMLQVRSGPAATSFEGELYVFGTNSSTGCATAERFVPALGRWEAMPSMLQGRERPASAAVFAALAAEIAEGLQRHCSLRQEHDTAETQFFEIYVLHPPRMTQIEEFEARKKEATDGYNRELDMRATASVKFQLAKDRHYCERVAQQLQDQMAAQMSRTVEVMAEEHIKRIQRKWDVRQREKIMRHATDEKELQEMREQLRKRELHLQEQKAFLEVSLSRSRAIKAKLLLFELQARTQDLRSFGRAGRGVRGRGSSGACFRSGASRMFACQELENAKPAQRKSIRRMWTRGLEGALPAPGLLPLLSQELQIQRQWLIERGQHLELNPSNLEVEGRPLLATPSALICKLWEFFLEPWQGVRADLKEPSKRLTRVFRSELSETTAQNRRTEVVQLSGTLFDSQEVQKQVEQALNSLEATRRAHETLAERWALGSSDAEVHVTLSEKLEELHGTK
eukprot:g10182.t1